MTLKLNDFLLSNLDELLIFIYEDYISKIDKSTYRIFNPHMNKISENLICFDHSWKIDDSEVIYNSTHCFVYPLNKSIKITQHGQSEVAKEHLQYVQNNIGNFERQLKRDNILKELIYG